MYPLCEMKQIHLIFAPNTDIPSTVQMLTSVDFSKIHLNLYD